MEVTVVGAGLAGSECAFQLAEQGVRVRLLEQKPVARTEAQQHDFFAELVCSNSLRSADLMNAVGLLKEEMRRAGSLVIRTADATAVPAGGALAVDRERFGPAITQALRGHPNIEVEAGVVEGIPEVKGPVVLATGPLTGSALAEDIARTIGEQHLAYYDAIAPIVSAESLDWDLVFRASRYDKGSDDAYVNCPMDEAEYTAFVRALVEAEKVPAREFEKIRYFEGCLPVEVMAERGVKTLSFGPMKPVGLSDPRTGKRPHAVLQLRAEDAGRTAYNLVGCQTRMKQGEQRRVFGMVPGLSNAEFLRFGSVHRNTFVCSPRVLGDRYEMVARPGVYLAGQVSGVEGYVESAASGLVIGLALGRRLRGQPEAPPPPTTALGALMGHLRRPSEDFQPSNVVWSMFPEIQRGGRVLRKRDRKAALSERALSDLRGWLRAVGRLAADVDSAPGGAGEAAEAG